MPPYPWLKDNHLDFGEAPPRMRALKTIGVPYSDEDISNAPQQAMQQATQISDRLRKDNESADAKSELIALIAYLQRLGTDLSVAVAQP